MKKVFLDNLPKTKGIGLNKDKDVISWSKTIGCKVGFVYDDIKGEVEIKGYNIKTKYLTLKYLNNPDFIIKTDNFINCKLAYLIGKKSHTYIFDIGSIFVDNNRNLLITNREIRKESKKRWYKYTCNVCGWEEGWIEEGNLKNGNGCGCCRGLKVVEGINDICTTDSWMCDLGLSKRDAKKYTTQSGKRINVICPDCGRSKKCVISDIYTNKSIGCCCGLKKSFSEKFITNMLEQLNIDLKLEYSPKWIKSRRYDFFIPSKNIIIETHGLQHYIQSARGRGLIEEQENDKIKKEVALKNGIAYYIELDCRNSDIEWIKNSILNSELNNLFDLSKINWLKCEEFALSNLSKKILEEWNNRCENDTTNSIANKLNLCGATIINHLKSWTEIGKCDYNAKEELAKSNKRNACKKNKAVAIFDNDECKGIFDSARILDEKSEELFGVKLNYKNISAVVTGRRKSYKGFTFKYVDTSKEEIA